MGNLLARVKINTRIYVLIAIAAIGIGGVVAISSREIHDTLFNERAEQTRRLVEVAGSMVNGYYKRSLSGETTEEEAKKRALASTGYLKYTPHG